MRFAYGSKVGISFSQFHFCRSPQQKRSVRVAQKHLHFRIVRDHKVLNAITHLVPRSDIGSWVFCAFAQISFRFMHIDLKCAPKKQFKMVTKSCVCVVLHTQCICICLHILIICVYKFIYIYHIHYIILCYRILCYVFFILYYNLYYIYI
jgi:hypothetical protein